MLSAFANPLNATPPVHGGSMHTSSNNVQVTPCLGRKHVTVSRADGDAPRTREDFFQTDIVEYGSRYNRPDRFPRVKSLSSQQKSDDVRKWLSSVYEKFPELLKRPPNSPSASLKAAENELADHARQFSLRVAQGRLEEAMDLAMEQLNFGNPHFNIVPEVVLFGDNWQPTECTPDIVDHGRLLLSAVGCGDVAVAFEYAGLFPLKRHPFLICFYNLLMATYWRAGDYDAMKLAAATARRREIPLDAMSFSLLLLRAGHDGISAENIFNEAADCNCVLSSDELLKVVQVLKAT